MGRPSECRSSLFFSSLPILLLPLTSLEREGRARKGRIGSSPRFFDDVASGLLSSFNVKADFFLLLFLDSLEYALHAEGHSDVLSTILQRFVLAFKPLIKDMKFVRNFDLFPLPRVRRADLVLSSALPQGQEPRQTPRTKFVPLSLLLSVSFSLSSLASLTQLTLPPSSSRVVRLFQPSTPASASPPCPSTTTALPPSLLPLSLCLQERRTKPIEKRSTRCERCSSSTGGRTSLLRDLMVGRRLLGVGFGR